MRRAAACAVVAACALVGAAVRADAATQSVDIQFAAFGTTPLEVLPGDTVTWTNVSTRQHTVTSDVGIFGSPLLSPGDTFSWSFQDVGAYPYHCTVHAGMVGEVDVRRVTLAPLPPAALATGTRVQLVGRTADASRPVWIQRSGADGSFTTVATATPAGSGEWHTSITARATGSYRAASGTDVSETRRLLVSGRRIAVHVTRRGVRAVVRPSDPSGRVVLQQRLRERFGWWTVARKRLDFLSEVSFRVRRPARVRVVLVDRDGWTPLTISRVAVLGDASHRRHGGRRRPAVA